MADFSLSRTHHLGGEEIRRRVEDLAQKLVARYGGEYEWQDATVRYARAGVTASIVCAAESIRINVTLGALMGFLRATIERDLAATLDDQLAP